MKRILHSCHRSLQRLDKDSTRLVQWFNQIIVSVNLPNDCIILRRQFIGVSWNAEACEVGHALPNNCRATKADDECATSRYRDSAANTRGPMVQGDSIFPRWCRQGQNYSGSGSVGRWFESSRAHQFLNGKSKSGGCGQVSYPQGANFSRVVRGWSAAIHCDRNRSMREALFPVARNLSLAWHARRAERVSQPAVRSETS